MKKRDYVAVYFDSVTNMLAARNILSEIKKPMLQEYDIDFRVMVLLGKEKHLGKFFEKLDEKHIYHAVLDLNTYDTMRDTFYSKLRHLQWMLRGKNVNESKEEADGKTLSNAVPLGKETRNSEKDRLPMGEGREDRSEEGRVSDAGTGRPASSGKGSDVPQVAVPDERVNCPKRRPSGYLKLPDYSKRYNVPERTARNWAAKGVVRVKTDERTGGKTIHEGPLYPWREKPEGKAKPKWQWKPWKDYRNLRKNWDSWNISGK